MFQFVGYDAFGGPDALRSAPSQVDKITSTRLTNAIFDHFNVTKNTNLPYNSTIPTEWDYDTIMDADFNGNIGAGNIDFLIEQISAIKIKRRKRGTFQWLTLETIPINKVEDLTFLFIDRLNAHGVEYEYAFVPILEDIEGDYIINSILSKFNGIFIGDFNSTYRLLYGTNYGTLVRNQQVATFNPLGKKYPVIMANGLSSYDSGTVSATILDDNFDDTRAVDAKATAKKLKEINNFLANRRPKILRDMNGCEWLCMITTNIQTTYDANSWMTVPQIQFNWTEIGDAESQSDLYSNGVLDSLN